MIDISKTNLDKRYDIYRLIRLTFKLVHRNINKLVKSFFISLLIGAGVLFLASMLLSVVELSMGSSIDVLFSKINSAMIRKQSLFTVLNTNELIVFSLFVLEILGTIYIIMCVVIKSIVGIDTGVERIESKKVNEPTGNSFLKILVPQILAGMVIMAISLLSMSTPTFIYILLFIIIQITTFLVNQFINFSYFEVLARGENVEDSFSNAFINLFFSRNGLIIRSAVGRFLILIAYIGVSLVIIGGGALIVIMLGGLNNTSLAIFVAICVLIAYIVVTWYYTFYITIYSYLVYMLNEVRHDKVHCIK